MMYLIITLCYLVLCAEVIEINPFAREPFTLNLIHDTDDMMTVEFVLNRYHKSYLEIDGERYMNINVPSAALLLERGNPELPIIARSLMIPHQSRMDFRLERIEYTELEGNISPSKGSIRRRMDPSMIPFEFSYVYRTDAFFPENIVELNDPYILFGEVRGTAFRISPFSVNPVSRTVRVHERLVFTVYTSGGDDRNILSEPVEKITSDFINVYQSHFLNFSSTYLRNNLLSERGRMLVVAHPNFYDEMLPFVEWKRQKGIPTEMITPDNPFPTVGSIKFQINNHIDPYFPNARLAFVLLVGDAGLILNDSNGTFIPTHFHRYYMRGVGFRCGASDFYFAIDPSVNFFPQFF